MLHLVTHSYKNALPVSKNVDFMAKVGEGLQFATDGIKIAPGAGNQHRETHMKVAAVVYSGAVDPPWQKAGGDTAEEYPEKALACHDRRAVERLRSEKLCQHKM